MTSLTLSEFISRRSGDREPLLDFKWFCETMPFGFDTDYVETIDLPFPSLNVKPMFVAAKNVYFPGFLELSAFDIVFYEDSRARSRQYLREWQERIRDPSNGAYYLPTNYKRDIDVALQDTTGAVIMRVRLKNCWPTQSGNWSLQNGGGQRLTVQQNFATDGVEYL